MIVSYLYTPALLLDSLLEKRAGIEANALVVDLEDSIHVNLKEVAREKLLSVDVSPIRQSGIQAGIRINSIATYDGIRDLQLLQTVFARPECPIDFILIPKVNHASEVRIYRSLVRTFPVPPRIFSFIETLEAVENANSIAAASDALCFGQADLVSELFAPNDTFIKYARAAFCVAAAKHSIPAIDTNSFEIVDMDRFEGECIAARSEGFTGKAAIHPKHVPIINRVFAVTGETVQAYRTTIDAYMSSPSGFVIKDGAVLAPPFVAKARKMIEFYNRNPDEKK